MAANHVLIAHAALRPGLDILDVAAGTGLTAAAALPFLAHQGSIICYEPSAGMRALGERRLRDPLVRWTDSLPDGPVYERILCGAAIWQLLPLKETFIRLSRLLAPGGCLVFNIPSLYLRQPDEPGGGQDPLLLELMKHIGAGRTLPPADSAPLPDAEEIQANLVELGLQPQRWFFRYGLTQSEYRDWLKIPVLTEHLFPDLDPAERAARVDQAFAQTDAHSWRWERWAGWTCWKHA
jgi:SAM-dependent methyltransferase